MAATARKIEKLGPSSATRLALADDRNSPNESPARALQNRLEAAFSEEFAEPEIKKLPGAVRLILPLAVSGGMWAVIIAGVRALLRN